jgi:hypothetical protein
MLIKDENFSRDRYELSNYAAAVLKFNKCVAGR